jgi:hypothetical protein
MARVPLAAKIARKKKALIAVNSHKKPEKFLAKKTAMSAIAHHTDIDSPPLANLPALSVK